MLLIPRPFMSWPLCADCGVEDKAYELERYGMWALCICAVGSAPFIDMLVAEECVADNGLLMLECGDCVTALGGALYAA